jgi:hypothetical protein
LELPVSQQNGMDVYLTSSRPSKTKRSGFNSVTPDK